MTHTLSRRTLVRATGALGLATALHTGVARAQTYPTKAVKVIVGAAPGGPGDFMGRLFADAAAKAFGQTFIVENKPGASGTIAASAAAAAAGDGYTLFASGPAPIVSAPYVMAKLDYDAVKQFAPIAMLGAGGFVLAAHPSVPVTSVAELIALAKAKPRDLTYGSGGNGSSGHLCTEAFAERAGIEMLHVPYKGDGPAAQDLLGGQINVLWTAPNVALPHKATGKLKILAVSSRERFAKVPDVPAVHETLPDFEYLGWIMMFAPTGTPQAVIEAIAAFWDKTRQDPAVKERLDGLGMYPPARFATREAVVDLIRSEHARTSALVKKLGIKPE